MVDSFFATTYDAGGGKVLLKLYQKLDLPQLQESGLLFSTGRWHHGITGFTPDALAGVSALVQKGQPWKVYLLKA
jgi:hypothetical protein